MSTTGQLKKKDLEPKIFLKSRELIKKKAL